jgi:hypothetical protein
VKKRESMLVCSCDETWLSVHRSKNHVRLSAKSLDSELLKLLLVHLLDLSNRQSSARGSEAKNGIVGSGTNSSFSDHKKPFNV